MFLGGALDYYTQVSDRGTSNHGDLSEAPDVSAKFFLASRFTRWIARR